MSDSTTHPSGTVFLVPNKSNHDIDIIKVTVSGKRGQKGHLKRGTELHIHTSASKKEVARFKIFPHIGGHVLFGKMPGQIIRRKRMGRKASIVLDIHNIEMRDKKKGAFGRFCRMYPSYDSMEIMILLPFRLRFYVRQMRWVFFKIRQFKKPISYILGCLVFLSGPRYTWNLNKLICKV